MRILIIGLTKELPLSPFDAMDIADKLVARAANAHTSGEYHGNQYLLSAEFCLRSQRRAYNGKLKTGGQELINM